ncbi:MAG: hypothetical protein FD167_2478 [bacterium]|nr:MAG: hypothetical protein FD167_2478 [bacterium]
MLKKAQILFLSMSVMTILMLIGVSVLAQTPSVTSAASAASATSATSAPSITSQLDLELAPISHKLVF